MSRFAALLIVLGVLLIACGVPRDMSDKEAAAIAKVIKQQEQNQ